MASAATVAFYGLSRQGVKTRARSSRRRNLPNTTDTTRHEPAVDDAGDFAALSKLRKRFELLKCSAGIDACDIALQHFFHRDAEPPA